jgi:hypothetical protein
MSGEKVSQEKKVVVETK